jgi:hypothetical protein
MTPTAISQVLEQFVRVGTVFIATWFLLNKGLELTAQGQVLEPAPDPLRHCCYCSDYFFPGKEGLSPGM